MSSSDLVPVGNGRLALPGIELTGKPPTRIYISGYEYKIQAPRVALPPIVNVIKTILNWVGPAGRIAKTIWHIKTDGAGSTSTSDPAYLQAVANRVMTAAGSSSLAGVFSSAWTLQSVTCRDLGGTSATATSTSAAYPGGVTGGSHPPQVAYCVSWNVAGTWRGGKPRTYVPGVPFTATSPAGSSTIDPTFAANADTTWTAMMSGITSTALSGSTIQLGMVSYYHAHAVRPTPLFYQYTGVRIHERLDSQRRRSGLESSFPVTPL